MSGNILKPESKSSRILNFKGFSIEELPVKINSKMADSEVSVFQIVSGSIPLGKDTKDAKGAKGGDDIPAPIAKCDEGLEERGALLKAAFYLPEDNRRELLNNLLALCIEHHADPSHRERLELILSFNSKSSFCTYSVLILLNSKTADPLVCCDIINKVRDNVKIPNAKEVVKAFYEKLRKESVHGCFADPQKSYERLNKKRVKLESINNKEKLQNKIIHIYEKAIGRGHYPDTDYLVKNQHMLMYAHWVLFCCHMCDMPFDKQLEKLVKLAGSDAGASYWKDCIDKSPFSSKMDEFFGEEKKKVIEAYTATEFFMYGGAMSKKEFDLLKENSDGIVASVGKGGEYEKIAYGALDQKIFYCGGCF